MHTNPFATEAAQYAHLRPTYPEELLASVSTTVASREVARDYATGTHPTDLIKGDLARV